MGTFFEFLAFLWRDFLDWMAAPERAAGSRMGQVELQSGILGILEFVDRKALELLTLAVCLFPILGYFLGKAASAVFDFWFGMYG